MSLRFSSLTPRPGRALPAIFVIYLCHLKHITFSCAIWITKWLTNEIFGWLRSWSSGSSATSSKCYLKLKRLILKLILHFPSSFHLLHVLDLQYSNIQNSFQSRVKSVSYFLVSAVNVSNIQLYLDNYMRLVLFLLSTKQPNMQEQTIQIKM